MNFREVIGSAIQSPAFTASITGEKPVAMIPLAGGTVSVVYRAVLAGGASLVLKLSEHAAELHHEMLFLQAWSKRGVRTPKILHYALLPDGLHGALLHMEFVPGLNLFPLMEAGSVDSAKVLRDIGAIMATMHRVEAEGYGPIVIKRDDKLEGEKKTFGETLASSGWCEVVKANQRNGDVLAAELPLIDKAGKLLDDHRAGLGGCFVHGDFRAGNILYDAAKAQPYTVIDPKPALSHPYLCLAYSLILEEIHGRNDPSHLRQGYEAMSPIDDTALHAALLLQALELLPRWGQPGGDYAEPLRRLVHREKAWLLRH